MAYWESVFKIKKITMNLFFGQIKKRTKGEAKREANKPRIAFGLLKEPDVPELENDDDNDEMEPKRKRKTRAIPTRKAKERMNIRD